MPKCKECEEDFTEGKFVEYDVCDSCERDLNKWPFGGETCGVCDGEIKYIGNRGYEQIYECLGCDRRWCYD